MFFKDADQCKICILMMQGGSSNNSDMGACEGCQFYLS